MAELLKRSVKKLASLVSAQVRAATPRAMAGALVGSPLDSAESTPLDPTGVLVGIPARLLASPGALSDPARDKLGRLERSSRADERACVLAFLLWRADECRGRDNANIHELSDAKRARVQAYICGFKP